MKKYNLFLIGLLLTIFLGKIDAVTLNDLLPVPSDFKTYNASIPHGTTVTVSYYSSTVGGNRKAMIYTPPGYSSSKKYNVFYCLHGINGNEGEWNYYTDPDVIMDNLVAKGKVEPMIVVFPNATLDAFESDLLNDLMPYIESHYSVYTNAANRALAGYSWGGGQSLNIGLGHMDKFHWIGGLSSAPDTKSGAQLVPNPQVTNSTINLLWLSCGDQDDLLYLTQNLITDFTSRGVNFVSYIQKGMGHNITPWEQDFYLLVQMFFKTNCTATSITPYVQVNGGTWNQTSSATINSGTKVILGPQPSSGGSWSWSGSGTSGSSREQTIYPTASGTATATYTNSCGAKSTQNFVITVNGSTPGIVSGGTYEILARHSGKALDVRGWSTADGGTIDQWTYGGGANQQFVITDVGNGYYEIVNVNSGKAIDVNGNSSADGAKIIQWTYSGGNNQQWQFIANGSYYNIKSRSSGKCLDVRAAGTADGDSILQWTCGSGTNQQFSITRLKSALLAEKVEQSISSIYPNPLVGNQLTIDGLSGASTINVIDLNGKVVKQIQTNSLKIQLDVNLKPGIYLVQVINSQKTVTHKLVIK